MPPLLVFIVASTLMACGETEPATTAEQRGLGHVELRRGLEFEVRPGTIQSSAEATVTARASQPLPRVLVATGPDPAELAVTLANIHRRGELRVHNSQPLDANRMLGCPAEPTAGRVDCAADPADPICEPPAIQREDDTSQLTFTAQVPPCTELSYTVDLSEADRAAPLTFAVLGRTVDFDQLRSALAHATADDPDFVVLLGDNAENASLNGLRELELVRRGADYPAVVLPGEDEIVEGSREPYLQTFGPLDFSWQIKGVEHVAFYSASAKLGERGIQRLSTALERMESDATKLTFTHTPPVDPLGPRDRGFNSELEGIRTLSTLTEFDIDALFVGHINDTTTERHHGLNVHLTSVERSSEYLWVRADGGEVSVERRGL